MARIKHPSTWTNIWSPDRTNWELYTEEVHPRILFLFPFQFLFKKIGIGSFDEAAKSLIRFLPSFSTGRDFRQASSANLFRQTRPPPRTRIVSRAMTSAKLWFAHRQCSERQTNSRSIQWLHCAPTSVWSLLVNHAEQPSLSDPYRWIRGLVFARDDSSSELFVFFFRTVASPKKKKRNLEERGERENELTNSKSFVCRVFLSPSVRRGTAKERERERKRKGGAREDLWTGSTPMHLPTPFASSCSLVAGNYRRGNFWYDSNDGKGSLLDLDAFFLPFLFFCFFLFFFFFARDRVYTPPGSVALIDWPGYE